MKNNQIIVCALYVAITVVVNSCQFKSDNALEVSIVDYVTRKEYNKECKQINPDSNIQEVNYKHLRLTLDDPDSVMQKIGEPEEILTYNKDATWLYDEGTFNFQDGLLVEIWALPYGDAQLTLWNIVKSYGCPQINLIIDQDEEPDGNYDLVVFSYPDTGIEFRFSISTPFISIDSAPTEVRYFIPHSLSDFIAKNKSIHLETDSSTKLIDWDVVVKN